MPVIEASVGTAVGFAEFGTAVVVVGRGAVELVGGCNSAGKTKNQNRRCQRRREPYLPQPDRRIERQPAPDAALLGRLQRFLQSHARSRNQVGRGIARAILRQQRVKLLLRLQFGCAVSAAGHVLLQFVTGVIRQLAINLKHDILSHPFTFHRSTFIVYESRRDSRLGCPGQGEARPPYSVLTLISYPPAPPAISGSRETKYSSPSLP